MSAHDSNNGTSSGSLSEEAAYWWIVLHEKSCTPADREAFAKWVRRSPERVEAFLCMSMLSSALKSPDLQWLDTPADELVRQARAPSAQIIPLYRRILPATAPGYTISLLRRASVLASVAFAALLVVLVAVWLTPPGSRSYRTVLGEQRSVVLEDGSIITMNTSSEIEIDYSRERRLVRLNQGEALFEVSHDPQRPFDVVVDDVIVRAVGTKFNVDRRERRTTVSVVEGTVKVMPEMPSTSNGSARLDESAARIVNAAQRIVLNGATLGVPEHIPDLSPLTAWTRRQLVFENRPVSEVAAEFNRYNRRQIVIRSPGLNQREITGVFQANDSYPFLVFILQIPGVHVDTVAEGNYVVTMVEQVRGGEGPKVTQ
jgi:transmembrane sensor